MKQAGKAAGAGRVLNAVTMATLWLAGAAGGWAAESAAGTHAGGGEAPFLNAWLLLGPGPGGEVLGLETDFIDEAQAMPRAGLTMAGKSWEAWDDRLYLYVLKTPVKTGWPASGRIEVEPESPLESWSCNGAEFINTGKKIPWTVEDGKVLLKLDGIQPDSVVSVIRLSVVVSRE